MKKYISRFHYLTQDMPHRSHPQQAQMACENGANWIQYRCLSKNDEGLLADINEISAICDDWGATLIVTNHVHLVHEADVQGVHIEDFDADLKAIRELIGDEKTLGASSTHFLQVKKALDEGADYTGYGPFAHTDTKPNEMAHVGVDGYLLLIKQMQEAGIDLPVIACGGVGLENAEAILATGVYGVAVSSAINRNENPGQMLKAFYQKIY